jgi:hypothetical protein
MVLKNRYVIDIDMWAGPYWFLSAQPRQNYSWRRGSDGLLTLRRWACGVHKFGLACKSNVL